MTRYEAYAQQGFQEKGMTQVVVTRTDDAGWLQVGVFLLDLYCLGVKDAFTAEMPAGDWPETLEKIIPSPNRVAFHPACARKLVEGAVAYTEALGFAPHRDYKKARRVFGSVTSRDCPETFTYGKNGKPFFVAGPNDDEERIDRVVRVLTAKLGKDGFHYLLPNEPGEANEFNREELLEFFRARPDADAGFAALDGFLAALHVCPTVIEPSKFLPIVWAGTPPWFHNEEEARQISRLVFEYWNEVGDRLDFLRGEDEPESAADLGDDPEEDLGVRRRAAAWCQGFLRVVHEWPAAWEGAPARVELRPHFAALSLVAAYGGGPALAGVIAPAEEEDLPRYVGTAVMALYAILRPELADDSPDGDL
jgi:yecA family protein